MSSESDGNAEENIFFTGADFGVDFWQTVHAKRKYRACTAFWTIAALSAFGATIYFSTELIMNYWKYDSYNQVSQDTASSLTLPAFTICNLNTFNITKMDDNINSSKMELYNELVKTISETSGAQLQLLQPTDYAELDEGLDIMRNFSVDPTQLVLIDRSYDYRFAGDHYRIDFQQNTHATELGYCIDFNDDGSLVQYSDGQTGGFEMDLDIMSQFYSPDTKSAGLLLFLRFQNEVVLVNDGGILLKPGSEHFIKLAKQEITRMSGSYGTCRDEASNLTKTGQPYTERSVRECKQDAKFDLMKEICMCLPFYLYSWLEENNKTQHTYFDSFTDGCDDARKRRSVDDIKRRYKTRQADGPPPDGDGPPPDGDGPPPDGDGPPPDGDGDGAAGPPTNECSNDTNDYECNFAEQQLCLNLVLTTLAQGEGPDLPAAAAGLAECYASCAYPSYETTTMSSNFPPTERYYKLLLQPFTKYNYTFDEARENLVRVHIYYGDLTVTNVDQTGAYDVSSFIAELGGTFDLFIGVSFYTMLQLLEILFGTVLAKVLRLSKFLKVRTKKVGNSRKKNISPQEVMAVMAPVTHEVPLSDISAS